MTARTPANEGSLASNEINWAEPRLLFALLNQSSAHVVAALWANRVRRHRVAALWAVTDLTFFDSVVTATFAGSTIAVFSLWDSHGCIYMKEETYRLF